MVPGTRALAFAARWFDSSTVSNVFEPLIADWQSEWRDAAGFARFGVRIRGGSALLLSMITASPSVLLAPWPAGMLRKIVTRVTIWTAVVSTLMMTPYIIDMARRLEAGVALYLLCLLLPASMALAFPFAITTVVDLIRTAPQPVREERLVALKFGIAAVTLTMMLVGWGFPAANQQYRVASMRAVSAATGVMVRGPARGLRELSLVDLWRDDSLRNELWVGRESWVSSRAEAIRTEIAQRTALIVLPIVLMWMRWRALLLPRGRWYSALPLAVSAPATVVFFFGLLSGGRALADVLFAPGWSGPWLALAVTVVSSAAIDQLRRRAAQRAD